MNNERLVQIEKAIRKLSRNLFTSLNELVKSIQREERDDSLLYTEEIESIDPVEMLSHISEAITDLISLKHTLQRLSEYTSLSGDSSYQEQLQSLEGEVRNHIKLQLQMKMYMDSLQETLENSKQERELQRLKVEKAIFTLESEKKELMQRFNPLKLKNDFERVLSSTKNTEELQLQINQDKAELSGMLTEIKKLQSDEAQLFDILNKSSFLKNSSLAMLKVKFDIAEAECLDLKKQIRIKIPRKDKLSRSPLIRSTSRVIKRTHSPLLRTVLKNPYIDKK